MSADDVDGRGGIDDGEESLNGAPASYDASEAAPVYAQSHERRHGCAGCATSTPQSAGLLLVVALLVLRRRRRPRRAP